MASFTPRVPSYSSSDTEEQKAIANRTRTSSDSTPLKYTKTDSVEDKTSQNMSSVHPSTRKCASLPNKNASRAGSGRPLMEARKPTSSRSATPTRQQQRAPSTTKPSRASTPSSLVSAKPVAVPVRANSRSSTPTARATAKSASRSSTPTHRPSTTSSSSSSAVSARSSSVPKRAPTMSRNLSPTVTSRPSLSRDDSTKRSSSASRARPSSPLLRPSTTNNATDEISRCKSHSSSRSKTPTAITAPGSGSTSVSRSRGHSVNKDDVNPVVVGTKMVERVVNMRKLAPAKPDASRKSSYSQESSGFGTSFSKKALDMALRHMDIKRRTPGNLRPVSTAPMNGSSKSEPAGSVSDHLLAMIEK